MSRCCHNLAVKYLSIWEVRDASLQALIATCRSLSAHGVPQPYAGGPRASNRATMVASDMHSSRRDFLLGSYGAAMGLLPLGRALDPAPAETTNMLAQVAREVASAMPHRVDREDAIAARIKAISNVFEVGKPEPEYDYVERLNDGRGYTVTNYGFCTATGEVSSLIRLYAATVPDTPLKRFLALMPPAGQGRGSLSTFPAAWRQEIGTSDRLVAVCDEEADRLFFNPAMAAADKANIHSPVGRLVFYDTWLQHGGGDDPDSFNAIYARARQSVRDRQPCPENDFIRAFLGIRKAVLLDPTEPATRAVWRESAPRVDALLNLLNTNPGLVPPITVANAEVHIVVG